MTPAGMVKRQAYTLTDPAIVKLWQASHLPVPTFSSVSRTWWLYEDASGQLGGVVGVEPYGQVALLRSLAVTPELRGQGIGNQLVWAALTYLKSKSLEAVYLLTESAQRYFEGWNFIEISRDEVPKKLHETDEMMYACPKSATVMRLALYAPLLRVRRASYQDAESIATIYNQGIADRVATFETAERSVEERLHWLTDRDPRYGVFVAEDQDRHVVGWLALNPFSSRAVYEGIADVSIYVARKLRGQGAGTQLLHFGLAWARAHQFHKLVLTLFPENQAAHRLYERHGFQTVGILHQQAKLDGIWRDTELMECMLEAVIIEENS